MKLLFVCTENKLRSATAETVFNGWPDVQAIGAGTNADAITPVSGDLIEWADIVFAMEKNHRQKIASRYASLLKNKRVVVLGITDSYTYMQPELVHLLERKLAHLLPQTGIS